MLTITDYSAGYDIQNKTYFITVKDDNQHLSTLPIKSVEEFTALLVILGREGVIFDPIKHALELPLRPVGT